MCIIYIIDSGEGGKRVVVGPDEAFKAQQSVSEFGFNMVASDKISLTRNTLDTRMSEWVVARLWVVQRACTGGGSLLGGPKSLCTKSFGDFDTYLS